MDINKTRYGVPIKTNIDTCFILRSLRFPPSRKACFHTQNKCSALEEPQRHMLKANIRLYCMWWANTSTMLCNGHGFSSGLLRWIHIIWLSHRHNETFDVQCMYQSLREIRPRYFLWANISIAAVVAADISHHDFYVIIVGRKFASHEIWIRLL